jgi:integrase
MWVILDGARHFPTGCAESEIAEAERKLAQHVANKYVSPRRERDIEDISIADVLNVYFDDSYARQANQRTFEGRIKRLNEFWGHRVLADVNGETCREYCRSANSKGGARRDLEDLRAAINHHNKEGFHRGVVRVTLPERGRPRERWLTRSEVAKLLWTCWRYREVQTIHRGSNKGVVQETAKHPLRHLVPFILISVYTGSRSGAVLRASTGRGPDRSHMDLENGVFYRLPDGARPTRKRQPPIPISERLLAHLRRWVRLAPKKRPKNFFVEWDDKPVASVKTAFASAIRLAELPGKVVPHTLRHTAATWLMQSGVPQWEVGGYLGLTTEMIEQVYATITRSI